jgi:ADP-heptose:LPS heptosyltransferase
MAEDGGRPLFTTVVERLGDLFEPRLCDVYAELFSGVIAAVRPEFRAEELIARYRRVRRVRRCDREPAKVFVLSRITLGADVAVTSVVLCAAKQRFPKAEIYFVGPGKNFELFAGDRRIRHFAFDYPRGGSLEQRLRHWPQIDDADAIVIDPDSRLSQLGLLPVCPEENCFFFESRSFGGNTEESLVSVTSRWVREVVGVENAAAYIAPLTHPDAAPDICVSFGVGENLEKRVPDPFEPDLLAAITSFGRVLVDTGASREERRRAEEAIRISGAGADTWRGPYAPFAEAISRAKLYIGYDSAGQHVAAACGTPLVSVFAGPASERMFQRWKPSGPGPIRIVRADGKDANSVLQETLNAAAALLESE